MLPKGSCKTIDIKDVKDMKGFWVANTTECLSTSVERFQDQCFVEYYCRNNQSVPDPRTIKCVDGNWENNSEAPTCKSTKHK